MSERLNDLRQRWQLVKLKKSTGIWIAIGAILITMILGFTRGGWMTEREASRLAETAANAAVLERLAPMCLAQFNAAEDRDLRLQELLDSPVSRRSTYVKDQGWATMPGDAEADNRIATECVKQIISTTQ